MNPDLKAARALLAATIDWFRHGDFVTLRVDDARAILAALDEQEWRPIETLDMPDYDCFDGWSNYGYRETDCYRADGRVWVLDPIGERYDGTDEITHWRPLPAPPVEKDT